LKLSKKRKTQKMNPMISLFSCKVFSNPVGIFEYFENDTYKVFSNPVGIFECFENDTYKV